MAQDPAEALRVLQRCEQMIAYGHQALTHFPRVERHVMSQEIRTSMWDIHRLIVRAHKKYTKKTTLQELDIEVAVLRARLRVAVEVGHLPPRKHEVWSEHLAALGAMTGAWLRSAAATGG